VKRHDPIDVATRDGGRVVIREMDESYVFAGDTRLNPATGSKGCCTARGAIDPATAVPDRVFESYHREAMRRYGQSAVLAWHGGLVVGFVNFHPVNARFDNLCPGRDPAVVETEMARFRWPDEPSPTLRTEPHPCTGGGLPSRVILAVGAPRCRERVRAGGRPRGCRGGRSPGPPGRRSRPRRGRRTRRRPSPSRTAVSRRPA